MFSNNNRYKKKRLWLKITLVVMLIILVLFAVKPINIKQKMKSENITLKPMGKE